MKTLYLIALMTLAGVPAVAQAKPDLADRMSDALKSADKNRDGAVTRAEFMDARDARFDRFDRNHDGFMDSQDLPRAGRARAKLDDARRAFDSNGDGRISRTEFADGPTLGFDRADLDGNGVIDGYELKQLKD